MPTEDLRPKGVLKGEVRQERMLGDGAVLEKASHLCADLSTDLSADLLGMTLVRVTQHCLGSGWSLEMVGSDWIPDVF